ncbi:PK beta-barrel-protein domain-containing protein-like protein [Xylariaceae sp. AK1471]|nr:PK beta-barrel-protein domain-containing protein-like protein [Xylariaceae sp. AK1471]
MSVHAVAVSASHVFSKELVNSITLVEGLGVKGDCHNGKTVQHRSRLHIKPAPANLRQVHLIPFEILVECGVQPAEIGENITTTGIDLLALGLGTKLHFVAADAVSERIQEPHAIVIIQGVRNPCPQIDNFRPGLKEKFIVRDEQRTIVARRAGVMGTVEMGGEIKAGMRIVVDSPDTFMSLECV